MHLSGLVGQAGIEPTICRLNRGMGATPRCPMLPVSPGCQAAASVFALTPMTSGCPASVFPSGFAVCQGLAPCGPTSGHGYAPCGRWRYSLRKASRFFQLKTVKNSRAHPRWFLHRQRLSLRAWRIVLPWGWQRDSARRGPVFPGSQERIIMRLAGSSRPGTGFPASHAPHMALALVVPPGVEPGYHGL